MYHKSLTKTGRSLVSIGLSLNIFILLVKQPEVGQLTNIFNTVADMEIYRITMTGRIGPPPLLARTYDGSKSLPPHANL